MFCDLYVTGEIRLFDQTLRAGNNGGAGVVPLRDLCYVRKRVHTKTGTSARNHVNPTSGHPWSAAAAAAAQTTDDDESIRFRSREIHILKNNIGFG